MVMAVLLGFIGGAVVVLLGLIWMQHRRVRAWQEEVKKPW